MGRMLIKEEIFKELEVLSETDFYKVIDFIKSLRHKTERQPRKEAVQLDPERDPILEFIGGMDVESFAHRIDEELYGER